MRPAEIGHRLGVAPFGHRGLAASVSVRNNVDYEASHSSRLSGARPGDWYVSAVASNWM